MWIFEEVYSQQGANTEILRQEQAWYAPQQEKSCHKAKLIWLQRVDGPLGNMNGAEVCC